MSVSVYKTFAAGEVLTASDLNSSFSQIVDNGEDLGWPSTQAKDLNGTELILDADADTSITADTDDQIDFRLSGSDLMRMLVTSSHGELKIISTVADATAGPILTLDRNSASPAASDVLGEIIFRGRDSTAASTDYAVIKGQIADETDASEDARIKVDLLSAGSTKTILQVGSGSSMTLLSDDAGATVNPQLKLYRQSASPADNDILAGLYFDGNDDGATQTTYGLIEGIAYDVTDGTEDGGLLFNVIKGGSSSYNLIVANTGVLVKDGAAATDTPNGILEAKSSTLAHIIDATADHATFDSVIVQVRAARTASSAFDFVSGNSDYDGTPDAEFRLKGDGTIAADSGTVSNPAGFAEMFEWADGNPQAEDRVGITVALDGAKIKPAQPGDTVIGVITGNPTSVGNAAPLKWTGRYQRDKFNRRIKDANGNRVQAEDFDPTREYTPRLERPEWGCVSLLGQEIVIDGQPTDPRWIKMEQRQGGVSLWLIR